MKITDIFHDEETKITEDFFKETQILDPVLHKEKMWKKHNNKPHSVTMDIRGNKGLFAYFRKFKSIIVDEKSGIIKIVINIHKKSIQRICSPLTLLLSAFYENHCLDLVGHTGLEKKTKYNGQILFSKPQHLDKNINSRLYKMQTNKVFANTKTKSKQEQLATTKT